MYIEEMYMEKGKGYVVTIRFKLIISHFLTMKIINSRIA